MQAPQSLAVAGPGGPTLSAEQQQILMNYQMLLSQATNLNMQGLIPGFPGVPQAMVHHPPVNTLYLQQAAMATQMNPMMRGQMGPPMMDFRALSTAGLTPTMTQGGIPSFSGLDGQGRGLARPMNNTPYPGAPQGKPQ